MVYMRFDVLDNIKENYSQDFIKCALYATNLIINGEKDGKEKLEKLLVLYHIGKYFLEGLTQREFEYSIKEQKISKDSQLKTFSMFYSNIMNSDTVMTRICCDIDVAACFVEPEKKFIPCNPHNVLLRCTN